MIDLIPPICYWGLLGGAFAELGGFVNLRERSVKDWPDHVKSKSYWVITSLFILAGAGLVFAYSKSAQLTEILAINIGASAPLIIAAFAKKIPTDISE